MSTDKKTPSDSDLPLGTDIDKQTQRVWQVFAILDCVRELTDEHRHGGFTLEPLTLHNSLEAAMDILRSVGEGLMSIPEHVNQPRARPAVSVEHALAMAQALERLQKELFDMPEHGPGSCVEDALHQMDSVIGMLEPEESTS